MKRLFVVVILLLIPLIVSGQSLKLQPEKSGDSFKLLPKIEHLKEKAIALTVIGAGMYIFRNDLRQFSIEHDKLAHVFLSYGLTKFFGWKFALGFMLSIEATQADIFGTEGRYKDTTADLFCDVIAIGVAIKF